VDLAREQRVGVVEATRYVIQRIISYVAAPLFPLLGVVMAAIPLAILGFMMRADIGVLLAGLLWFLVLLDAFLAVLLLIGVFFGWPFLWVSVSADNADPFDSMSRTYSYVFQRPLHFLFYAIVAGLLWILGWLLVSGVVEAIQQLAAWGVSWGTGSERTVAALQDSLKRELPAATAPVTLGFWMIDGWHYLLTLLVAAFSTSFVLVAACGIYLLLREHVDGKDLTDVYLEDAAETPLPPLAADEPAFPAPPPSSDGDQGPALPQA
jgi:hypothetical protein